MSLRAVEEDVAHILEASGLGSTTSAPPTIYAGPIPAGAPDACIACLESSSEPPEKYLSGARLAYHRPEVTVLVRGTAGDSGRLATAQRARAAWDALWDLHLPEYVRINPTDGGPTRLGPDANGRAQYSFTIRLEYVLATTSGLTVPLPARGPLHVPELEVAGQAKVSGLLLVPALPFAGFPSPTSKPGGVLFATDVGLLHVSDGAVWLPVGAPQPVPSAAQVPVTPSGNLSSTDVQAALVELQADVDGKASTSALATKADASALAAHTAAQSAHGVTGALVGTTDTQTLSNKKHSGVLEVVDVAAGAVAFRLPAGSFLALTATGDRYLVFSNGVIQSNTAFAAPAVTAGAGIGNESAAYAVAGSSNWLVARNGRIKRLSGDTTSTAGNASSNTWQGRAKVAAGQASVTISNNLCLATSTVLAHVHQATADASGAHVVRTSAVAGALTIYLSTPPTADVVVAWELRD